MVSSPCERPPSSHLSLILPEGVDSSPSTGMTVRLVAHSRNATRRSGVNSSSSSKSERSSWHVVEPRGKPASRSSARHIGHVMQRSRSSTLETGSVLPSTRSIKSGVSNIAKWLARSIGSFISAACVLKPRRRARSCASRDVHSLYLHPAMITATTFSAVTGASLSGRSGAISSTRKAPEMCWPFEKPTRTSSYCFARSESKSRSARSAARACWSSGKLESKARSVSSIRNSSTNRLRPLPIGCSLTIDLHRNWPTNSSRSSEALHLGSARSIVSKRPTS
mmetsp:Transcript_12147/g.31874  ORF Transcript_12147/g.31874 Transcript_12147/m.31874 type:complete len:280 (+) Transcript_12147:340-1179(+)